MDRLGQCLHLMKNATDLEQEQVLPKITEASCGEVFRLNVGLLSMES